MTRCSKCLGHVYRDFDADTQKSELYCMNCGYCLTTPPREPDVSERKIRRGGKHMTRNPGSIRVRALTE